MSALPILARTIQKTNIWLRDARYELAWNSTPRAYLASRAVLHALRDRLSVQEVAQLGAELPIFIRGVYYEGWNPARTPAKNRKPEAFLEQIRREFAHTKDHDINPEHITRAILWVLHKHISRGELAHIKHLLPRELRKFWPAGEAA